MLPSQLPYTLLTIIGISVTSSIRATSIGDTVQIMYSDDQTGIVIPENHMLLQAMLFDKSYEDAFAHTVSIFHMKDKKQKLQEKFAKNN